MKKIITASVLVLGLAFTVGPSDHAAAVTDTPISAGAQKKCEVSKANFDHFSTIMQQYRNNYYEPVSDADLAKYYTIRSTVFLDGTKHDVHSSSGKVPVYDGQGHLVTGTRLNYSLVVRSHNGTIDNAKAIGHGIETKPGYLAFVASNAKLDAKVKAASAQIGDLISQWNLTTGGTAQSNIDCKTPAGVAQVAKYKALRKTDFGKMKQSLQKVQSSSFYASHDLNKMAAEYKKILKADKKAKASAAGNGTGGAVAP